MKFLFLAGAVLSVIPLLAHWRFDGLSLLGCIFMFTAAFVIIKKELKDS